MTTQSDIEEFSLPEMRERQFVTPGRWGSGVWHVMHHSTFLSGAHEGRWTRRAADRRALCGGLSACLVGIDAADWPTERQPIDISQVTCKRCRQRYAVWERKQATHPPTPHGEALRAGEGGK